MTSPQGPDAHSGPARDDAPTLARPYGSAVTGAEDARSAPATAASPSAATAPTGPDPAPGTSRVDADAGPGGTPSSYVASATGPRPEQSDTPTGAASTPRPAVEDPQPTSAATPEGQATPRAQAKPDARASAAAAVPARPSGAPAADGTPTTVLPDGAAKRPVPQRGAPRPARPAERVGVRAAGRTRKARLALKRVDPWSVFVFSLVAALFLGVALVVAVAVLYAVLSGLGVLSSVNELFSEVTGGDPANPLITSGRVLGGAAVFGAVNVVLLTLLATLGALLYNVCASFTGGVEVTLGERDG